MSSQLLISQNAVQTRVVLLQDGEPVQLWCESSFDTSGNQSLVGNIYLGIIKRIVPSLSCAFVDIGLSVNAFLPLNDCDQNDIFTGKRLVVQVKKDGIGQKGATVSSDIALSSRYLVYFPLKAHNISVSKKIEQAQRQHIKAVLTRYFANNACCRANSCRANHSKHQENKYQENQPQGAWLVRTVAKFVDNNQLLADVIALIGLWQQIVTKKTKTNHPAQLYCELSLAFRCLKDELDEQTEQISVDNPNLYASLKTYAQQFAPNFSDKLSQDSRIFAKIEPIFKQALNKIVPMPCGGYLVIEATEAMTIIDVNSGSLVANRNDIAVNYRVNREALQIIAKELRLRNISGIIIVDLIDMSKKYRKQWQDELLALFKSALAYDPIKSHILGINELGLLTLTRKRTHALLSSGCCEPCPTCQGDGVIKNPQSICFEIITMLLKQPATDLTVIAHSSVIGLLSDIVAEITALVSYNINLQVDDNKMATYQIKINKNT